MKFKKLYSSSAGNSFILTSSIGTRLLIECGGRWNDLMKGNGFNLDFAACLSSHCHADHSANIPKLLQYGITCYMTKQTADKHKALDHHNTRILAHGEVFAVSDYTIMPLQLSHLNSDMSDCECYAFYIKDNTDRQTMLFATDFHFIPWKLPKDLQILAIECDYDENIESHMPDSVERRRSISHCSLQTLIEMFKENRDTIQSVQELHILHLSANRASADVIRKEIQRETGKVVLI